MAKKTTKINLPGLTGPSAKGIYSYKKRTPAALLNYIDKKELWIPIGKTIARYDEVVSKIETATQLAENDFIPEEQKKELILNLLGEEDKSVYKKVKVVSEEEDLKISNIFKSFIKHKTDISEISDKTVEGYERTFKIILSITGDVSIFNFNAKFIDELRVIMKRLPNSGLGKYQKNGTEEIVKKVVRDFYEKNFSFRLPEEDLIKISTVNKSLVQFNAVLKYFYEKGENNEGFKYCKVEQFKDERDENTLRLTFNENELSKMLNGYTIFSQMARVFYFSGLRPAELLKGKLKVIDGITVFSLLKEDITTGVKLKNKYSHRLVPVHKKIENDIVEVIKYFNSLKDPSGAYRYFKRHFVDKKVISSDIEKKSLYSLRHNFATKLNEMKIDMEIKKRLMGHAQEDLIMKVYTKDEKLETLNEVIQSM